MLMNGKVTGLVSFVFGALSGAGATYIFIKHKYDADFQKKREEMIEYYEKKVDKQNTAIEEPTLEKEEPEKTDMMAEARRISEEQGYKKSYNTIDASEKTEHEAPYIVDDMDFYAEDSYEKHTINCYEDGTVTDENGEVLSEAEVEEQVGTKNIDKLYREEMSDSIYVRNDRLMRDYEVIEKIGRYADE